MDYLNKMDNIVKLVILNNQIIGYLQVRMLQFQQENNKIQKIIMKKKDFIGLNLQDINFLIF